MKKSARLLIGIASIFALAACSTDNGSNQAENEADSTSEFGTASDSTESINGGSERTLVAYFSYPVGTDLDVVSGASVLQNDGEYLGLVEQASIWISEELEADSFLIEPAEAYPDDVRQIIDEVSSNDAPDRELTRLVENFDNYDTIYLGYPIWMGTLPPLVQKFLESHDFTGKTVIPYTVHGGSDLANTVRTIQEEIPEATVVNDALSVSRNDIENSQQEILDWLAEITAKDGGV